MPKAYWIVRVSVRQPERYPNYLAAARPAFEKFGARFIVRGGEFELMEGDARERNVVVEFEILDAGRRMWLTVADDRSIEHPIAIQEDGPVHVNQLAFNRKNFGADVIGFV